jgi:hypothetical protein
VLLNSLLLIINPRIFEGKSANSSLVCSIWIDQESGK